MDAVMNTIPPIEGVPRLSTCATGVSARTNWPRFSLRNALANRGVSSRVKIIATPAAVRSAITG